VKRSPQLAHLSRDHHVTLVHAQRLRRATPQDVAKVAARFLAYFVDDGERHFACEEAVLLPAVPSDEDGLRQRLLHDHTEIRHQARALGERPTPQSAAELGTLLAAHIRFEESELFPILEARMAAASLADIGRWRRVSSERLTLDVDKMHPAAPDRSPSC
jgi:hypothetical protein